MSRVYTSRLSSGARAASTCVDLDGMQVLITLTTVDGAQVCAELAFRRRPGDPWSQQMTVCENVLLEP